MCYKNYDEWVGYTEKKFEYSKKRSAGGFRAWFNDCVSSNEDFRNELNLLLKAKTPEVSLMMATVAKVFDAALYDEKKHMAKSRDDGGKQTKYSSGAFYKAIKLAWENDELQICIPNDDVRASYYWIEVVSALQKRFGIFKSLDDLNQFVFSVGNGVDSSELCIYGFYLRNVNELCLAYSILHGYSIEEYKQLLSDCSCEKSRFCGEAQQTATVEIIQKTFEKFLEMPFIDDRSDFISTVIKNAGKMLISKGLHAQAIKNMYNKLIAGMPNDTRRKGSKERGEYIVDLFAMLRGALNEFTFNKLKKQSKKQAKIDGEIFDGEHWDEVEGRKAKSELNDLRKILAYRFYIINDRKFNGLRKKTDPNAATSSIVDYEEVQENDIIEDDLFKELTINLRYYLIALCMKKLIDNRRSTNTIFAIEYINQQLRECGFRPIEVTADADNTIKIEMKDVFDWFVVNALKLEELVNPKGQPISGYRTFLKYVFNHTYQEHKA